MNRRFTIIGGLILLLLTFLYWNYNQLQKKDWSVNYYLNWNSAYSVSLFYNMLEDDLFEDFEFMEQEDDFITDLSEWNNIPANYIFIGRNNYMPTSYVDSLHKYISSGHNAMIICEEFTNGKYLLSGLDYSLIQDVLSLQIMDSTQFYVDDLYEQRKDNKIYSEYTDSIVNVYLKEAIEKSPFSFTAKYVNFSRMGNSLDNLELAYQYKLLGYEKDSLKMETPYFIQFNIGEGKLFLHTNPLLFTNYFLKTERGLEYVSHAMSYLDNGSLYFDERSIKPYNSGSENVFTNKTQLEFILENKELKWAWYLIIIIGVIYIIFNSKREQRLIPYIAPLKNTSIDFAETIGRLFYYQKDHKFLADRKMKLFLKSLRLKYRIPFTSTGKEFRQSLHTKTEVNLAIINSLFDRYEFIIARRDNITEEELNDFFSKIKRLNIEINKMKNRRLETKS